MADDFQVGSGNWWGSSRNPSSSVTAAVGGEGLGWTSEERSSDVAPSISGSSNLLQDPDSTVTILAPHNSDLQIMGLGLNSHHTIDWNPNLLRDGEKADNSSFRSMLQEQWRQPKLYSGGGGGSSENSTGNVFKQSNRGFSLDNQSDEFNSEASESYNSDPMIGYGSPSTILLQGLLATSDQDNRTMNNSSNYAYPTNYGGESPMNAPWLKFPNHHHHHHHQYMMNSPPTSSTHDDQSQPLIPNNINAPFWNNSPTVTNDAAVRPGFFQSSPPPPFPPPPITFEEKPEVQINNTMLMESGSVDLGRIRLGKRHNTNTIEEASNKRARSEASPSPLPPFKVRKEKMGDRITALQQLVSPFGKTDTASVLSEAIEYIKFLHEQIGVLSSPYMKNGGGSMQKQQQQHNYMEKSKEVAAADGGGGAGKQDLRSRGLCLVPVSSTFPVTHEPTVDYWNPTFGGTFR